MQLSEYLEQHAKTAADVSRDSGVPVSRLSDFLNGKTRLSQKNVDRLVGACPGITRDGLAVEGRRKRRNG